MNDGKKAESALMEAGECGQAHARAHEHAHDCEAHDGHGNKAQSILTVRSHSGLSGDILLAGLAAVSMAREGLEPGCLAGDSWLDGILGRIMPELGKRVQIRKVQVNGIEGLRLVADLPHAHEHRNLEAVKKIIAAADMAEQARQLAAECFELLARCEAQVHGKSVMDVHFHEVGALDSILDICAVCELAVLLAPAGLICSPLPMSDGQVACAHGILPAPAPAALRLLQGIPVKPFEGSVNAGELATPTALALLKTLKAEFGAWPSFTIERSFLVYGNRVFANAPNGAVFALGKSLE